MFVGVGFGGILNVRSKNNVWRCRTFTKNAVKSWRNTVDMILR